MGRNDVTMYLDTVEVHPELSERELDKIIADELEKSKDLKDFPMM